MYRDNDSGLQILEIEITNRCNLACSHCYVDKRDLRDMEYSQAVSLIDQGDSMGVNRVVLTGGEPLLYPKLFDLASHARQSGIPELVLLTNGILITEKNVDKLKVFDLVQMSFDLAPKMTAQIRPNYYRAVLNKVKLLKSRNIQPLLFATLYKSHLPCLDEMIELAKASNVRIAFDRLQVDDGDRLAEERMSNEEYSAALRKIARYKQSGFGINCTDPLIFLEDPEKLDRAQNSRGQGIMGGCTAGIAALYITVCGNVFPCPFLKIDSGNITQDDVNSIWENSSILNRLRHRETYEGACGTCELSGSCGGCRAASLNAYKTPFASDPACFKSSSQSTLISTTNHFNILN